MSKESELTMECFSGALVGFLIGLGIYYITKSFWGGFSIGSGVGLLSAFVLMHLKMIYFELEEKK